MNYTNNIDKYYIHAHYNQMNDRQSNRNKILWLLLLSGILLAGLWFLYQSYQFDQMNNGDEESKLEKSVMVKTEAQSKPITPVQHTITTTRKAKEDKKETLKKVAVTTTPAVVAHTGKTTARPTVTPDTKPLEKLNVVESQKLNSSSRESVLALKLAKQDAQIASRKSLATIKSHAEKQTTTNSTKVVENGTIKKESGATTAVQTMSEKTKSATATTVATITTAKATDVNSSSTVLSELLPAEMFHLYVISKGETLYSIALKQYNDRTMYKKIIEANPDLENPNNIHVGQEILLPIINEAKSYSDILHFK